MFSVVGFLPPPPRGRLRGAGTGRLARGRWRLPTKYPAGRNIRTLVLVASSLADVVGGAGLGLGLALGLGLGLGLKVQFGQRSVSARQQNTWKWKKRNHTDAYGDDDDDDDDGGGSDRRMGEAARWVEARLKASAPKGGREGEEGRRTGGGREEGRRRGGGREEEGREEEKKEKEKKGQR